MADIEITTLANLRKDITGSIFGRWTVLRFVGIRAKPCGANTYLWLCRCACGAEKNVNRCDLVSGRSQSCGCLRKDWCTEHKTTHGLSAHPLFSLWTNMINRCTNPKTATYPEYGGRGITVCDRWQFGDEHSHGLILFLADMGERPSSNHSVDRIDNNKGYSPENCRWATPIEQHNNTRANRWLTYNGETRTVAQWSRVTGIGRVTLEGRLDTGWSVELTLSTPLLRGSARRPKEKI